LLGLIVLSGQTPAPDAAPSLTPNQIFSRTFERFGSYPVSQYVVWIDAWSVSVQFQFAGPWGHMTHSERRAENLATNAENVSTVPLHPDVPPLLPHGEVWPIFQGPFAWSLRQASVRPPRPNTPSTTLDTAGLKVIATVLAVAKPDYAITLAGIERIGDRSAYHLQLRPNFNPATHQLRDVWADVETFDLLKVHLVGKYGGYGKSSQGISDSDETISFAPVRQYWIADGMTFTYTDSSDRNFVFATKTTKIVFPETLPDWLFNANAYVQQRKAGAPDILTEVLSNADSL
jgi:hypothetical protein